MFNEGSLFYLTSYNLFRSHFLYNRQLKMLPASSFSFINFSDDKEGMPFLTISIGLCFSFFFFIFSLGQQKYYLIIPVPYFTFHKLYISTGFTHTYINTLGA